MNTKVFRGSMVAGLALLAAGLGLAGGCASLNEPRPPPVTVSEIREMAKAGVPARDIIQKIQASGTVYRMQASELAELRAQGVPDDVINYMQQTYLESVRRDQGYYRPPYGPYGYGGFYDPYGWPYPSDIVIIDGQHHEHHEHHSFH